MHHPPPPFPPPFPFFRGAFQALAIATLLYQVCVRVDAFFDGAGLPDGYTQRNIAVTLRTVGRGLAYLLTFIYAANGLGLLGLAPGSSGQPRRPRRNRGPARAARAAVPGGSAPEGVGPCWE